MLDTVGWTWKASNAVGDLTTSNEGQDDGCADNKGESETVDAIPRWCPASSASARVLVVHVVEDEELGDQGVFDREEDGGPGESSADDTDGVAGPPCLTTELGPFEAPVDGSEEGDDLDVRQHVTGWYRHVADIR